MTGSEVDSIREQSSHFSITALGLRCRRGEYRAILQSYRSVNHWQHALYVLTDSGYGYTNGHKTTALELKNVFEGLTTNGLLGYSRILTGYIPGAEALQVVAEQMSQMRKKDPGIVYVLDRKLKKVLG